VRTFNDAGYYNIEHIQTALPRDDLLEKIKDVYFVGIRSRTDIDKEVLDAAEKLVGIGCFCIGSNQVDLEEAMCQGIPVFNAPYSNTRSVAELVVAEMILLLRGIPEKNWAAHEGLWAKSAKNSFEVRGKKLGIIGYGNIGCQVSVLAESIGMDVFYYDIVPKLPMGNATSMGSMNHLLRECDIVSLHVPETNKTIGMIGKEELDKMKETAVLVNASRGSVVDNDALAEAIKEKKIKGAAIDVHNDEPNSKEDTFKSPLKGLKNVILTPHVGGSTEEAQDSIGESVADKLIKYSDTGATVGALNFPQVTLTSHPGTHRLLHIHRNIPGIMSQINNVFSEINVNIAAQHLQTNENIGYVVIHVDKEYSQVALDKLREIEGTIKCRVLY